jgi:hypothetical protein
MAPPQYQANQQHLAPQQQQAHLQGQLPPSQPGAATQAEHQHLAPRR